MILQNEGNDNEASIFDEMPLFLWWHHCFILWDYIND